MNGVRGIQGLLAVFDTPAAAIHAARALREAGYTALEAYTPYPVEGLAEALAQHRTRLPLWTFAGGALGVVGGYFMQWYANVVSYPLDVAGRPDHSWPAFLPVTFELGVLGAALTAVGGLFAALRLPRLHHPAFGAPGFERASRDRFFVGVAAADPRFRPTVTRAFLYGLDPEDVVEVP